MSKGLLSGILSGGVVGTLVMGVLSLYAPLPQDRIDAAPKLEATQTPAEPAAVVDTPDEAVSSAPSATTPAIEAAPEAETVAPLTPEPSTTAPTSEPSEDSAQAVTAPVVVGQSTTETATGVASAQAPEAQVSSNAATVDAPRVSAESPATSSAEVAASGDGLAPVAATETAAAAAPSVAASAQGAVTDEAAPTATSDAVPAQSNAATLTQTRSQSAARVRPSGLSSPTIVGQEQTGENEPTQVAATRPAPKTSRLPTIGQSETEAQPASADTPIVLPTPSSGASSVITNRLPSVTSQTPTAETPAAVADAPATPEVSETEGLGALARFSTPVEGIEGKSLMAFILIDSGEDGLPRDELMALSIPVTVAIDPVAPNAAAIMAQYRAAGIEVATIANDLPTAAGPGDVATAVSAYFDVLNQSVAIMDPLDGRIQANRNLLQPVLGAIRNTGHGLITYDRGLNTAQQAARRESIPAATVFRVLDADLEKAPKIKRYLDRAAFTANQDGAVVVVGRSYPETVRALVEWSLEKKDASIAVVPVSAVMLAGTGS